MAFERDAEYLTNMKESDLVTAITINSQRMSRSEAGTRDYTISKERLDVFVPEALRRGLTMTAALLIYIEDINE